MLADGDLTPASPAHSHPLKSTKDRFWKATAKFVAGVACCFDSLMLLWSEFIQKAESKLHRRDRVFFPQGERHLPELLLWLDPVLAALPLPLMELNKLTAPVRLRIQNIVATLADGLTDGESGLGVEVLVELTE